MPIRCSRVESRELVSFNLRIESLVIERHADRGIAPKMRFLNQSSFNLRIESLVIERQYRDGGSEHTLHKDAVSISELRVLLLRGIFASR